MDTNDRNAEESQKNINAIKNAVKQSLPHCTGSQRKIRIRGRGTKPGSRSLVNVGYCLTDAITSLVILVHQAPRRFLVVVPHPPPQEQQIPACMVITCGDSYAGQEPLFVTS